jgi:hypothetical protein
MMLDGLIASAQAASGRVATDHPRARPAVRRRKEGVWCRYRVTLERGPVLVTLATDRSGLIEALDLEEPLVSGPRSR